jgi:predicted deacetylase
VFIENLSPHDPFIELVCINCSREWFIEKDSEFGKWLREEKARSKE